MAIIAAVRLVQPTSKKPGSGRGQRGTPGTHVISLTTGARLLSSDRQSSLAPVESGRFENKKL
jgi:hypothetical protein